MQRYAVYLLECANDMTYFGIARDVEKRFAAHCAGKGAKFTRANPPKAILGICWFESRSAALQAEYRLKKLSREQRFAWATNHPSTEIGLG